MDPMVRMLNIIKKTNVDTISNLVSLTVKSINPIQFSMGDKILFTEEFVDFASNIDTSKIEIGDKFKAISLNADQMYYIIDIISSTNQLDKYIQRIERIERYLDIN